MKSLPGIPHRVDKPAVRKSGDLIVATPYTKVPKLTRRPLYKRERRPDFKAGVLKNQPPVGMPNASGFEIISAIDVICRQNGIRAGQGGEYDRQRDVYVIIGKSGRLARPMEYDIPGWLVADLIAGLRSITGVARCDPDEYRKKLGVTTPVQVLSFARR